MLKQGIALSESVHDHMTLCIHYGHLAYISEQEGDATAAVAYAKQVLNENRLYRINIPHIKISYVNAVEAFVYALECGVPSKTEGTLLSLANEALKNALEQGKTFRLITGPAFRAAARLALYHGQEGKAAQLCHESLRILQSSPYEWEYSNTLKLAARCFPEDKEKYLTERAVLLDRLGITR